MNDLNAYRCRRYSRNSENEFRKHKLPATFGDNVNLKH